MVRGSCLCGDVAWQAEGPFELMSHCHCSMCRKSHGTGFSTVVAAPAAGFRVVRGESGVRGYESSPGNLRSHCPRCGSMLWSGPGEHVFMAAGCLDDDPGVRPIAHIFVASKAPWYDIPDSLPQFEAYPPGVDIPSQPDRTPPDPPGKSPRGSCLCGSVAWVVEEKPFIARFCHCSRCRRARGAAHASNMVTRLEGVRFTRAADMVATYKVPEAKFFSQSFCRGCGSPVPRLDEGRKIAIVPMGGLDDDPGIRPSEHIWTESKAPWFEIADELPQHPGPPPG